MPPIRRLPSAVDLVAGVLLGLALAAAAACAFALLLGLERLGVGNPVSPLLLGLGAVTLALGLRGLFVSDPRPARRIGARLASTAALVAACGLLLAGGFGGPA